MSETIQSGLDRVHQMRQDLAEGLGKIADIMTQVEASELAKVQTSGSLGLETEVITLKQQADRFRQGRFRLLVLGDVKRGKSTFLNALLGERLLPSDVNPCTAVPTIVQAGSDSQVTIHFHEEGRSVEKLSVAEFQARYTIDPESAKKLEEETRLAFPEVHHAVLEHPLPLLGGGVELIDSPGLNDTEARNELSLNYAYHCNAILFVLDATQPCTLDERRYLQNYLRDRGLTIFFLINRWDELRSGLVNPDDQAALQDAETKQRSVFRSHLAAYCQSENGEDLYDQRVFEISSLMALRSRLKDEAEGFTTSGFPALLEALTQVLVNDRAQVELAQAKFIAQRVSSRLSESVERRIPLLAATLEEFQDKIQAIETDFANLNTIHATFQAQIRQKRDETAKEVSNHFRSYISELEESFVVEFVASQPDLGFFEFLDKNNRNQFYFSFKRAFERYMNDRLSGWEFIAKQKIAAAFTELDSQAQSYKGEYSKVLETMNEKLMGDRYAMGRLNYNPESVAPIFDVMMDFMSAVPQNLNSAVMPFSGFWQTVLLYACIAIAVNIAPFFITIGMVAAVVGGLGLVSLQTESTRQQFLDATKREFAKQLPKIAEEYTPTVHQAVQKCFDAYSGQLDDRINADITSRKTELENLRKQKESHEIDREVETKRLRTVVAEVDREVELIANTII